MNISFGDSGFDWSDPIVNLGAVLLGSILAWSTSYFFEKTKEKQQNLAIGYSLMFKVQEQADEIWQLEKAVHDATSGAHRDGVEGPLWTKLNNIVGFNRSHNPITSEELALLARTKDQKIVIDVREVESGHRILKSILDEISSLKKEIEKLDLGTAVEGKVVTFEVTKQQYPKVAPFLIGLEELSEHLDKMLPSVSTHARKTATALGPFLKKNYRFKHFISLAFADKETNPLQKPAETKD
jgi:hypothetical protein